GEHHLHSRDDVFDLPVPRRVLPRGAARDPSTHRRQLDGLRPVPHRQCVFATQRLLEIDADGAGAHLDEARRIVNADDSAQCTDVECYAAVDGDGTAAHAAPATGGGDRDQIVVADAQDIGDLGGRLLERMTIDGRSFAAVAASTAGDPTPPAARTYNADPPAGRPPLDDGLGSASFWRASMADHLDSSTKLTSPNGDPKADITDIYIFQKPGDSDKSILILNVNPLAPSLADEFQHGAKYDMLIDTTGYARTDIGYRITFSRNNAGKQFAKVVRTTREPGADTEHDNENHETIFE